MALAISHGRMRARRLARPAALALAAGVTVGLTGGAAPVGRLDVAVDGVRSAKGLIQVCLTADPGNFPGCIDDADAVTRRVPAKTRSVSFDGLPAGTYAVAIIHDENGNNQLDTFAGIPREGFGFSRNPRIGFGPPRFTAAQFHLTGDAAVQQVRMRYIL